MDVQPVQSSGATLTEALTAAERQMNARPKANITPTEPKGSGFFARLLESLRAKPSWTEHPWQVGVNRRGQQVTATRWARNRPEPPAADLSVSRAESGKGVPAEATSSSATKAVSVQPPKKVETEAGVEPAAIDKQDYGYGLDEVLPQELLDQSPLLQRNEEKKAESSPEQVSLRIEEIGQRIGSLLAARIYDEVASARRNWAEPA